MRNGKFRHSTTIQVAVVKGESPIGHFQVNCLCAKCQRSKFVFICKSRIRNARFLIPLPSKETLVTTNDLYNTIQDPNIIRKQPTWAFHLVSSSTVTPRAPSKTIQTKLRHYCKVSIAVLKILNGETEVKLLSGLIRSFKLRLISNPPINYN